MNTQRRTMNLVSDTPILPLLAPLETLSGVGDKRRKLFKKLLGDRAIDALFHLPTNIVRFKPITCLSEAQPGEIIILKTRIINYTPATRRGSPHKITCHDGTIFFDIIYFHAQKGYLQKIFPPNTQKIIVGRVEKKDSRWQICHPDMILPPESTHYLPQRDIIYPLTTGITNRCVSRVIDSALARIPQILEWIPSQTLSEKKWDSWPMCLRQTHDPRDPSELLLSSNKARERLAYDELFAHQLALQIVRHHSKMTHPGKKLSGNGLLVQQILQKLPYSPTNAQSKCIHEIFEDMASPKAMTRLIQGDVGSGKTLVALLSMIRAVESNHQAAILAPTDILARQHAHSMIELCDAIGIKAAILTARETGKKRKQLLEELSSGDIQILIGTHAIIEDTISFHNLGLVVIDEQHRFGVEQRLKLTAKANNPDLLTMTATPIPRTLQLANYGDMEVSIIDEKPPGRLPIQTNVLPLSRLNDVIEGIQRALKNKTKIFWVCPLVEESEALNVAAAEKRAQHLKDLFGDKVGLVHGKLKASHKDDVMNDFIHGQIDILVATTVIEVGVNVPEATIMIIEHAERFGLSQLHQLRGRIGRGTKAGTCLLLYGNQLSLTGKQRLETIRSTEDGFKIAEADLRIRGGGDILGTRQSGLPDFKFTNFSEYPDLCRTLLSQANKDAKDLCFMDPSLTTEQGLAARLLLKLFAKDEAIKYIRS